MIKELDDKYYFHNEVLDDNNCLQYQLVVADLDLLIWRDFPHLNTTYNTNRFGMKLFQINGITSLGTIFPFSYALTHTEDGEFFT